MALDTTEGAVMAKEKVGGGRRVTVDHGRDDRVHGDTGEDMVVHSRDTATDPLVPVKLPLSFKRKLDFIATHRNVAMYEMVMSQMAEFVDREYTTLLEIELKQMKHRP